MEKMLKELPLFVEAARQQSFTKAADALDIPLSTVSRRIANLEKELGVPLFQRSARKVELTESGKQFFERCSFIVEEADAAREIVVGDLKKPKGRVRISMRTDVYHCYLTGALGSFAAQWPDIQLHVQFSERWVDLHSEPFDLDIRVGALPDSSLRVRKLKTLLPVLYASPKLLEFYPLPKTPSDLSGMPCICMDLAGDVWTMSKGNKQESVTVRAAHRVSSASLSQELALQGIAFAWLMPSMVARYEEAGELIRLLPGWTIADVDLNIVMVAGQIPQRVRVLVDYLADFFKGLPQ